MIYIMIIWHYLLGGKKIKRLECNSKFCYYYEALLLKEEKSIEEHKSCFLYLWWIQHDTDLLDDTECPHKGLYEKENK